MLSRAVFVSLLCVISGPVSPGQCRGVSSAASIKYGEWTVDTVMIIMCLCTGGAQEAAQCRQDQGGRASHHLGSG